jgi:hypothetical protein
MISGDKISSALSLHIKILECILGENVFFMKTATRLSFLLTLIIFFTSCQKEVNYANNNNSANTGGTGNTNDIIGVYDFVGLLAHTQSAVTVTELGQEIKTVTVSDYVSQNNTGTIKITSNQFISSGLGYSIDTTMNAKTYRDNVLFDDSDFPFVLSVPASNSTSPYSRITADSISVTGALGVAPDPSGTTPTGPVGVKISWSGDTLLLHVNTSFTQSVTQSGIPGTVTGSVNGITKLKRRS